MALICTLEVVPIANDWRINWKKNRQCTCSMTHQFESYLSTLDEWWW